MLGEVSTILKFFSAFVFVLALIGVGAWLWRRFGAGGLSAASARGRQARLGVIEAAAVDSRRRIVLVRRDNVEHLIMLGGPSDVVIETNIVRAQSAAQREALPPRAPEPQGRPAPAEVGQWPPAPEPPAFRPARSPERPGMPPSVAEELPLQPQAEPAPPPRAPAGDRLAGFAADLARASGARAEPPAPRSGSEPPPRRPIEPRRAPPAPPRAGDDGASSDRHLAQIAQQLEAALRRPGQPAPGRDGATSEPGAPPPLVRRPAGDPRSPAEPREPRSALTERPAPARAAPPAQSPAAPPAAPPPAEAPEAPVDAIEPSADRPPPSLEEEMASLLGRPPGKP